MAKQTINIGSSANDGQGDPLRTAMDKINDNFDEIYTAGPVSSNIKIANSTITTTNTNGNLLLRGNGTGKIDVGAVGNLRITGGANGYVLTTDGTGNVAFNDVGNITFANLLATSGNITQDLVVGGNLTVNGTTTTINTATLDVEDKLVTIAYGAANSSVADGAGISIAGANANITYANATNSFNLNKNVIVSGNILPSANVTYSLGNVTNQWKDLYVSNNTIYINNVPLSVTSGNVLTIGGQPLLSNGSGATISTTGNVSGGYILGNGSQLTGLPATYGNVNVVANLAALGSNPISTTGNVSGGYILGNGSQLTGIVSSYGNANVVANLAALGSNPISTTGNVTAGYILGNGSQLTGIVSSYGNANVVANLAALGSNPISTTGNITGGYILGNGSQLTGIIQSRIVNGTSNVNIANANGNATITANAVTWTFGTNGTTQFPNTLILAPASEPITMQSDQYSQLMWENANVTVAPNMATYSNFYVAQNNATLDIGYLDGSSNPQFKEWLWSVDGTMTLPGGSRLRPLGANLDIFAVAGSYVQLINSDESSYMGVYDSGGYIVTAGGTWGFSTTGNLTAPGNVSAVGSITGGNLLTGGLISATGNVTSAGNVTGAYILGNGSQLTGIAASYGNANVVANLAALGSNPISTTGNVTGGNILTGGLISATGNVSGGNLNVTGNIIDTGALSLVTGSSGNVSLAPNGTNVVIATTTGANITGTLNATGNVTGGNILTAGLISATGNVTAANFIGNISITGNVTGTSANVTLVAGAYSTVFDNTGNVTLANSNVFVGVTNTILTNTVGSFSANANSYTQVTLQNKNTGTDATVDLVVTSDNGSDAVNYGDFGIINSGYDNGTPTNSLGNIVFGADTYIYAQGNVGNTGQSGGNLVIGTTVATKTIKLFAGGNTSSALVATVSNTGITMNSGNITGNTAGFAIGYRDIPQVAFTANATIATTDAGKHYYSTQSTSYILTIANNASQGFQVGSAITVVNQGTGNITVAQGSGVTLYLAGNATSGNRTVTTFGMATIMKVATNTWFINGTGVS